MSKRKSSPPKAPIFDCANDMIDKMHRAVMYQTVKNFPIEREDFLICMFGEHVLKLLRDVGGYVRHASMQSCMRFSLSENTMVRGPEQFAMEHFALEHFEVMVYFDHMALGIAEPRVDLYPNSHAPKWSLLLEYLRELATVARKWDNVRKVKNSFNHINSFSRVKYIMPNFRSLMPADSLFHAVEPKVPEAYKLSDAGLTAAMVREAVTTITEGLLANPAAEIPMRNVIRVTVAVTPGEGVLTCGLY